VRPACKREQDVWCLQPAGAFAHSDSFRDEVLANGHQNEEDGSQLESRHIVHKKSFKTPMFLNFFSDFGLGYKFVTVFSIKR